MIGGDDFKSGQTKMKSVLVDFLVGAGIKVIQYKFASPTNVIGFEYFNCLQERHRNLNLVLESDEIVLI